MNNSNIKIGVALLVAAYFFYYLATPDTRHFIDNVNLIIHEAGHWIFWPFGEFLQVLGGSLNQVLVPCLFVVYFYFQRDYYSSALTLFWTAINLVNVSIYAADAVKMQLPLLGGDASTHDWNRLSIYTGMLHYTNQVAFLIKAAGISTALAALTCAIWAAFTTNNIINYDKGS